MGSATVELRFGDETYYHEDMELERKRLPGRTAGKGSQTPMLLGLGKKYCQIKWV